MKLQQLRYALEVSRHNLNVSEAAEALFTSQPGISKQIRLLEEELGIQIFIRSGKRVVSVSQPGKAVLELAERILRDVQNIKNIGNEFTEQDSGSLIIATTHTQARYALPRVVSEFVKKYPKVQLSIKQGNPSGISQMVMSGDADFAIATESLEEGDELRKLPCSEWTHAVLVPDDHPLLDCKHPLSITDLARFSLVTYEFAMNNNSNICRAFHKARLDMPPIALASADTDVLKTYVRLGLGVGLMAKMAYDKQADQDLHLIDASHLFEPSQTYIALRPDVYLRGYAYDFIKLFSSDLSRERIDKILYEPVQEDFSI
ncbi:CysB family HTH-type transcriptional regulator [Neisseria sp. Dent CA1/247]|uniref:CysB family HTH-type transcriptional regulator n=1 Tax=Neisseria TaxID=482 RepID=UPI001FD00842|nr:MULTISPECIES: CysB family HTH-type transcriptional regulator [Neisseria]MDO5068853.1 CysB family HTH-type transcriptional regulator [Neisseria zoodegmatis]UOO76604.1 CysB family HTH-type transcriptional regulator [Neisseria sp. Dent CA1/247]